MQSRAGARWLGFPLASADLVKLGRIKQVNVWVSRWIGGPRLGERHLLTAVTSREQMSVPFLTPRPDLTPLVCSANKASLAPEGWQAFALGLGWSCGQVMDPPSSGPNCSSDLTVK